VSVRRFQEKAELTLLGQELKKKPPAGIPVGEEENVPERKEKKRVGLGKSLQQHLVAITNRSKEEWKGESKHPAAEGRAGK